MEHPEGHDNPDTDQAIILKKALDEIKDGANMDIELLTILEKHIVTLQPGMNAIDQAVDEIENLAKGRTEV